MARDIIRTSNAPAPPPTYSQAVRAAGLIFVSGTGPLPCGSKFASKSSTPHRPCLLPTPDWPINSRRSSPDN